MYITFHLMDQNPTLLGIIFVGHGGSTFASGVHEPEVIASKAIRRMKKDWKFLYKFKRDALHPVHIFDISNCEDGWYAEMQEVYDTKTKKPAKFLKTLKVAK